MTTETLLETQHAALDVGTMTRPELAVVDVTAAKEPIDEKIEAACAEACQAIAPAWPLDRAIAVNPHWSRIGRSVREVAARMAVLGDIGVFPSRSYQREALRDGRITEADLSYALTAVPAARAQALSATQCVDALATATSPPVCLC